jgi:aspartyl-tRNA(Asn)/glutamyl-tRNA(Gln) amidotransferase subunit A
MMTLAHDDLGFASVTELGTLLRDRKISAVELATISIDRLGTRGRELNAVVTLTPETAMAQAQRADSELAAGLDRGPLHGIPYGAKDLLAARGYPTTWGAAPFRDRRFDDDAAAVNRLADAGAVLVAKLATVEFAGGFGYEQPNAAFTGPGRNAWSAEHWAGGSSSGSGAAVAAGCVPLAIGSETWGSIHGPAAYNGVTGFRPTYGLVSRSGAMALSWSMDKLGPLARSAADCELALIAIAGHDAADPATSNRPAYLPDKRRSGFRFAAAVQTEERADPEIMARFRDALDAFREIGTIEEVELPELPFDAAASTIIDAEAAAAFEEFLEAGHAIELTAPEDRVSALSALSLPATDYLRALRIRRRAMRAMDALLQPFDALLAPTTSHATPRIAERFREEPNAANARTIGGAANLCGLPGLALPIGLGRDGLPVSASLTGRADADGVVLAAGIAYQHITTWHRERPPEPTFAAPSAHSSN